MRRLVSLAAAATVVAVVASPLPAAAPFPETIPLPNGFQPEGIAVAPGGTFYAGSIPTGAVYRGDVKTGTGSILVPGAPGRAALGLKVDQHGRLFVAGGPTGQAFVYDARTGTLLASYRLTTAPTFVNDVVVTRDGAYFTDSVNQVLYRIPLAPNGTLGAQAQSIPLTGDIVYGPGFNANGIDATPDGKALVLVQTNTGKLFTVEPATGVTHEIALDQPVTTGDGILLAGRTLYVVRNVQNRVAVVRLAPDLSSGEVVTHLTAPSLDVPTTIGRFGNRLYAVNARFTTPPEPTTRYSVTRIERAG
jgi:sugar lactone lactonase YvrE